MINGRELFQNDLASCSSKNDESKREICFLFPIGSTLIIHCLFYRAVRRRATPGDALPDKAGGRSAAGGPRRGIRRLGRDRRDRPARRPHVPGARRQAPGEAASEQPAAGDEHQERPAESGLQQVGSSRSRVWESRRMRECSEFRPARECYLSLGLV